MKETKKQYREDIIRPDRLAAIAEKLIFVKKNVGRKRKINDALKAFEYN